MKKPDRIQKKIIEIYVAFLCLAIILVLYMVITGHRLPCIFHEITGLLCPGCGSTRMVLSALKGDFSSAFRYNPVAFICIPLWLIISIMVFINRPSGVRNRKILSAVFYVTIALYLIACIIRNFSHCMLQ